jgi:hypothetical protein
MKKQVKNFPLFLFILLFYSAQGQVTNVPDKIPDTTELFSNAEILPIKLSYSIRDIKKQSNDSTYIVANLSYQRPDSNWQTLEVGLRRRGNFRLENCYFPPIKIKLEKSMVKETAFNGHKKLKLVLPCLMQKSNNDNIVKEYMAYKFYEVISPYHFKTRMVDIDFTENRSKKTVRHRLKGILIEDDKKVAKRFNGKVIERSVHPLQQEAITCTQNDFFQYMIGNTDYSSAYQHNEKLLFINKTIMPVPYDFDMSGLVDASYAVVSQVQNQKLEITDVKQRLYRGFKRDEIICHQVRNEFLKNKSKILNIVDSFEPSFDDPKAYLQAKNFIDDFFIVLANDAIFKNEILNMARVK